MTSARPPFLDGFLPMGLDSVELVLGWEEAFGVEITPHEAARLRTPLDVMRLMERKLPLAQVSTCPTHRRFNQIRRELQAALGVERDWVRPVTQLSVLFPRGGISAHWAGLGRALGAHEWPELVRPRPVVWGATGAYLFGAAILWLWAPTGGAAWVSAAALYTILTPAVLTLVTRPFKSVVPPLVKTVGNLARRLVATDPQSTGPDRGTWSRERIETVVRYVISAQLGVHEFADDADFVRDLHID